jgi:hypothetical protein
MGAELPLPILAGVIGLGIPVLLLFVHLSGGSSHVPLSEPLVRQLLRDEDPSAGIDLLHLGADQHTALVRTRDGRRFVAWSMESHGAIRELPASARVEAVGDELLVSLADSGWPPRRIRLEAGHRSAWLDKGSDDA